MLIGAIGVMAVVASVWIYASPLPYTAPGPIRGDGLGYYAYLPALVLDHDLTFRRTALRSFGGSPTKITATIQRVRAGSRYSYLDQYGVGEAVLIAPFFGAAYVAARATNEPTGGFSRPFEAAVGVAGLAYMLLGLALTASVLRRWFRRGTVVATILGLTFGAAVFDYGTFEPSMSHAYAFFAIALVLRLVLWLWESPSLKGALALGGALGLVGLIRPTNLVVVLFCLLFGVRRPRDLVHRVRTLVRHRGLVAAGASAFVVVVFPQCAYWHHATGAWITDPYREPTAYLDLLHPHLFGVLFSVRKGLFFWTPLTAFAAMGLFLVGRVARPLAVPALVTLPVAIWVVASWSIWWYGDSFGMRALIDVMPIFAVGLAALIEVTWDTVARPLTITVVTVTTLIAVHAMLAYWLAYIPGDHTILRFYFESIPRL